MKVLFVAIDTGQARAMRLSMERRGHEVTGIDPYVPLRSGSVHIQRWAFHTGALFLDRQIAGSLKTQLGERGGFDVAFVDNGELISPAMVRFLKERARRVAIFNRDNPFVSRDGRRWRNLRNALPLYDLYATPRESTGEAAGRHGACNVLCVNFFSDEILHQPRAPTPDEYARFRSPVSFVGSWFPERGPFMQTLIERGVPLRIIGNKWQRARNWAVLQPYVTAGYLSSNDYCGALLSSDIAIAMLSKGNRDVTTSRSMEIPALGKLLCAERTDAHLKLYREGEEAIFWSSPEECADLCHELLANPDRIARIAEAGRQAAMRNGNWSEEVMERILVAASNSDPRASGDRYC